MVRSTTSTRAGRRSRLSRAARADERTAARALERTPPVQAAAFHRAEAAPGRSRRQGGIPQDRALYSCGCGYAFNAAVSTSVGCPHCGRTQAW